MPRSRRVKLLCLSIDVITELLEWWKAPLTRMVSIPKIDVVPDDVSVECIYPDFARQCYFARLSHPSFDDVPDGACPPEIMGAATDFITVGRGDAIEASWRTTVEMLNRERDEQLAIKQKEIDHFRQLLDARAMLAIPREQHVSEVSADLMNKMADVESKAARYDQLVKVTEIQQKRINEFDRLASSPALEREEIETFIGTYEGMQSDTVRDAIHWLKACLAEIDRLRCLLAIESQRPNRGSNYADYLRPEVVNSIRDGLVDFAGKEPGPLHEAARLGLRLADHIRACDSILEDWESTAGAALRRAEEILGAGNFDNIDHAAKRVVDERDRLKSALNRVRQIDRKEALRATEMIATDLTPDQARQVRTLVFGMLDAITDSVVEDHAAERAVEERDGLKSELAETKQPKDDYEASYRTMREERDELKRQLSMRPEPFAFEGRGKAESAIELLVKNCPPFQGRAEACHIARSLLAEIDRLAQELEFRKATMIIEVGSLGDIVGATPSPPDAPVYPNAFPTDMPF